MPSKKVLIIAVLILLLGQVMGDGLAAQARTSARSAGRVPVRTVNSAQSINSLPGIESIAAGGVHSCARTADGGVKCWGHNFLGQLGDGTGVQQLKPVDVIGLANGVTALAAGVQHHTCALMEGGGIKCWGYNDYGQLGDGTRNRRYTPVDVSELSSGVVALAAGGYHTCALTTSGAAKCWGNNGGGQLGDGTNFERLTPVNVVGLTSGVTALTAGQSHTCALMEGGGVKCWGANHKGQLGDGTTGWRNAPVDVSGLASGVVALAAGGDHTCALMEGGGVRCWGSNDFGQLGDGTTRWRRYMYSPPRPATGKTTLWKLMFAGRAILAPAMG